MMPDRTTDQATEDPSTRHEAAHKVSKEKGDKLIVSTNLLISQVQTLTMVVETNNEQIRNLRREVDNKPDDIEVQTIAGISHLERKRHLRFAVGMSVICAAVAASISFGTVDHLSKQRCQRNAQQTETLVDLLGHFDVSKKNHTIQNAIQRLNSEKVDC